MATGDNQLSTRDDELSVSDDQLVDDYLRRLRTAAGALPTDRLDELVGDIQAHIAEARAAGPPDGNGSGAHVRNVLERLGQPEDIALAAAQPGSGYAGPGLSAPGPSSSHPSSLGTPGPDPADSGPGPATPGPASPAPAGQGGPGPGSPSGGDGGSGGRGQPSRPPSPGVRSGPPGLDVLTVLLLLFGGLLVGIGWVAGVVLLWASPRWRTSDKVLGTLIWPGGLAGVLLFLVGGIGLSASSGSCSGAAASQAAVVGAVPLNTAASCSTFAAGWLTEALAISILAVAILGPILVAIRLLRRAGRVAAEPTVTLGSA